MTISQTANSWYSMSFNKRLRSLRKKQGMTQRQLSEASKIHLTQVQRYESGETQPTITALRKLIFALHVSADELVFDKDERDPPDDWRLQFEALANFTDAERQVAKAVIDGLILRHTANQFAAAR